MRPKSCYKPLGYQYLPGEVHALWGLPEILRGDFENGRRFHSGQTGKEQELWILEIHLSLQTEQVLILSALQRDTLLA